MAELPDGINFETARLIVAWEITKLSVTRSNAFDMASSDGKKRLLANTLIDVHAALRAEVHLKESSG